VLGQGRQRRGRRSLRTRLRRLRFKPGRRTPPAPRRQVESQEPRAGLHAVSSSLSVRCPTPTGIKAGKNQDWVLRLFLRLPRGLPSCTAILASRPTHLRITGDTIPFFAFSAPPGPPSHVARRMVQPLFSKMEEAFSGIGSVPSRCPAAGHARAAAPSPRSAPPSGTRRSPPQGRSARETPSAPSSRGRATGSSPPYSSRFRAGRRRTACRAARSPSAR